VSRAKAVNYGSALAWPGLSQPPTPRHPTGHPLHPHHPRFKLAYHATVEKTYLFVLCCRNLESSDVRAQLGLKAPAWGGLGFEKPWAELWAKARPKPWLGLGSFTAFKNEMRQYSIEVCL